MTRKWLACIEGGNGERTFIRISPAKWGSVSTSIMIMSPSAASCSFYMGVGAEEGGGGEIMQAGIMQKRGLINTASFAFRIRCRFALVHLEEYPK